MIVILRELDKRGWMPGEDLVGMCPGREEELYLS